MAELETLKFKSEKNWQLWLEDNHSQEEGIWLTFAKKNSGETTVNYGEAVEVALCYGWIDSQVKAFDEKFYLQKFSPRRARSVWSKINRDTVEKLIVEGKMKPSGMAQVEAAKADGRWDAAYEGQSTAELPNDFKEALAKNKKAADFYGTLNKTSKYSIIWRLQHTKSKVARDRNIKKFVQMLENNQKIQS